MKIVRRDKRVRCQKCYHEFWQDADLPARLQRCPRCGHTGIGNVLEYGKPVIGWREYEISQGVKDGEQ